MGKGKIIFRGMGRAQNWMGLQDISHTYDLTVGGTVMTVAREREYRSLTTGGITVSLAHYLVPARRARAA